MTEYKPEDYVNYRLQKAKDTILEVKTLIDNQYWNTAINRLYYACFYAVGALLIKNGVKTASHSGTRRKFGQLFVKPEKISRELAKHYTDSFSLRLHANQWNSGQFKSLVGFLGQKSKNMFLSH